MSGVRSYANALLIANLYRNIPRTDPDLFRFAKRILNPRATVVVDDCHTVLGTKRSTEDDVIGLIALDTDAPIDQDYLNNLYQQSIYDVRVRDTSTCTAKGGICAKCYRGHLVMKEQEKSITSVEYHTAVDTDIKEYLLKGFTISGDSVAYQRYIANTYSGSLVGVAPVPSGPLPLRADLWKLVTTHAEMDRMCAKLAQLKIAQDELDYVENIPGILERALLLIGYYGVYGNVAY